MDETDLIVEDCYTNPDQCEEYLTSTEDAVPHDAVEVVPTTVANSRQQAFPWPIAVAGIAGAVLIGVIIWFFASRRKVQK